MKHRDSMARWFTPGVIADIPTGNLLWVDAEHGNDDLAVRERMTVPFKTLTKAKLAAFLEDTIVVMPGLYQERDLLKHGVNWHFLPGARVEYAGSNAIFDNSAQGADGVVECLIGGFGEFSHGGSGATDSVLRTTNADTKIRLICSRITCSEHAISCENGSQIVEVLGDFKGWMNLTSGSLNLRALRLIEAYCVISGGTHWINAQDGSPAAAYISGGDVYWEVSRTVGFPVEPVFLISGGILRVMNSVVMAGEDICSPGAGIVYQDGGKCILKDSHVIDNESEFPLTGNGDLVCLGSVWSTKAHDPNVMNLTGDVHDSYFVDVHVEF